MPAEVVEREIRSAHRLVRYLMRSMMDGKRIYRGEKVAGWELRPSAWRPDNARFENFVAMISGHHTEDWFKKLPGTRNSAEYVANKYLGASDQNSIQRMRDLTVRLLAERTIVGLLADACDRVALPTPGIENDLSLVPIEDIKLVGRAAEGPLFARPVPTIRMSQTYAFAQHHKMPTRLLDFSDSPFKAAFFATENVSATAGILGIPNPHFAIWIATPPQGEGALLAHMMQGGDATQFRVLRSKIPYLHAQDGLFVACNASGNAYFLEHGIWPTFDRLLHGWSLEKIACPASIAPPVRAILDRMGINKGTMMPSYSEVAEAVRGQYM